MRTAVAVLGLTVAVSMASASFETAVSNVAEMVWNSKVASLASRSGLDIVNVTWEDTGRYNGSCWGPNISDMTIQVHHGTGGSETLTCMPVIRFPNFHDLTADIDPDHFYLLTGNENGNDLEPVSLTDYVDNIRDYLHDGDSWGGRGSSLLADRDSVVLVSAQAVFLPIENNGEAVFNPVLYNYQSYEGSPGVLAILATREGTSATIIDNSTEYSVDYSYSWGQRLYFNENGERASLTGSRISDFLGNGGDSAGSSSMSAAGEEGLNMVMLIQIPLRQKERRDMWFECDQVFAAGCCGERGESIDSASDVEAAVIGHGDLEGPFREIDGLSIARDDRFPIRVTVQFYKATSNGVAANSDIEEIAAQINRVYDDADYVGSLVCPEAKILRPTDWNRSDVEVSLAKIVSHFQ